MNGPADYRCRAWFFSLLLGLALCSLAGIGPAAADSASISPQPGSPLAATGQVQRERRVPLDNTLNTRDLGGYSAVDGRRVKWGMLYRSDSLAQLIDQDIATLASLGLSTITDFRSQSERDSAPDRLPKQSPPISYRTLAINDPAMDVAALGRRFYAGELNAAELAALNDRTSYIYNNRLRKNWGLWVKSLAEPGALPQLFHCTAGKDRTGFAAALVLLTLGVSKEDVMRDFLLSNDYLAPKIDRHLQQILDRSPAGVDEQLLREILGVSRASLEGAFAAMEANYGSIDGFIEQGLGIDADTRAALQVLLLE